MLLSQESGHQVSDSAERLRETVEVAVSVWNAEFGVHAYNTPLSSSPRRPHVISQSVPQLGDFIILREVHRMFSVTEMSCSFGHGPLTQLDFLARLPTLPRRDVHGKFHAGRFQLTEMDIKEF